MKSRMEGHSLPEVLVVLALLALFLCCAIPLGRKALQRSRLYAAARYLAATAKEARLRAVVHGNHHGIWFRKQPNGYVFAVYADGNRNGIRKRDILGGIDRRVSPEQRIGSRFEGVSFRILDLADLPSIPPDTRKLDNPDPIRISRSDILSFSPLGKSNGGTLYICSSTTGMAALRIFGPTCRMRIWEYDVKTKRWTIMNQ